MKSQQLWKNFVDQECHNAGAYIGSPMYEFYPMQKYAEHWSNWRVFKLTLISFCYYLKL